MIDSNPPISKQARPLEKDNILIVQSESEDAHQIDVFFSMRGYAVHCASNDREAIEFLEKNPVNLAFIDIHLPRKNLIDLLKYLKNKKQNVKIIITSKFPDLEAERELKTHGAKVFLRAPFGAIWIEKKIAEHARIEKGEKSIWGARKVRFPIRMKITIPYLFLALLISLAGAYIVSQLVQESIEERFRNQLLATGQIAADLIGIPRK